MKLPFKATRSNNLPLKHSRKMSFLFAVIALISVIGTGINNDDGNKPASDNAFIRSLKVKLNNYNKHIPEDRVYLQTDKPLYEPGDNIWFSGFLRDGQTLMPSDKSEIMYVELINPKGSVDKKIALIAKNGKVSGDFKLDAEAAGGLYKLKAYTNWMKNEGGEGLENAFIKELQVQDVILPALKMTLDFERKAFGAGDEVLAKISITNNENKALSDYHLKYLASLNGEKYIEQSAQTDAEGLHYIRFKLPKQLTSNDGLLNVMVSYNGSTESISRTIPLVLNKINFAVYPEGGDLVYGLASTVAFKAMNEFNKAADIEAVLVNDKGRQIDTFSSFHQGMGAFCFTPQAGEKYMVKITKPAGINETFPLPEPLRRGYVLSIEKTSGDEIKTLINSTETGEMALIAQIRGKVVYNAVVPVLTGINAVSFSSQNFPAGVCQITLFDSKGIARAERLCFVNRDKQLNLSIETDKEKYLPREKIKMTLSVKDERGLPMPANLSLAVVNDQLLSFADKRAGNIVSQLLLEQDLKQKVEEPAFYFNHKEVKSAKALDYLLMTAGWRRFTWEKIINNDLPPILFPSQKALLAGVTRDAISGKVLANVKIKSSTGVQYNSDANGNFSIPKLDLSTAVSLSFECNGYYTVNEQVSEYSNEKNIYLYALNSHYYHKHRFMPGQPMAMAAMAQAVPEMENNLMLEKAAAVKFIQKSGKKSVVVIDDNNDKPANVVKAKVLLPNMQKVAAAALDRDVAIPQAAENKYYRARQFEAPNYSHAQTPESRNDFRNTIYWNPDIEIGFSGKKTIEFFASDDITSFRSIVEGISSDGEVGRGEKNFYTQLPFQMSTKIPVQVIAGDVVSIPLTLKNNTNGPLGGVLEVKVPTGFEEIEKTPAVQTIMPGAAKTLYLSYKVNDKIGEGDVSLTFKSCGLGDGLTQHLRIAPKGFPVAVSLSGQEQEKEYSFDINKLVTGSLRATFNAYPNVVSDLVKGIEGILQEPYGCFEQTSCTAYPNAMVLDYLKTTDSRDNKTLARATDLLDRGYKRLTGFEASNKGYEWFGANPGHEGLTAYGIMEFMDMKRAGQPVDEQMLDRTARWLLNHRDGKGGFARETHAYHDFGRISNEVLNTYIVYALADAGFTDIKKEFEVASINAKTSKDAYLLAMACNAAFALKETKKGNEMLAILLAQQHKDGSFNGSSHSITYSQGESLTIETTALAVLAMLKADEKHIPALTNAVAYITSTRSGSGVFSSTQGTILALKCLTEYAKYSKRAPEDGTIVFYIDGEKVAEKTYKAGDKGVITVDGLEKYLNKEGTRKVKVKYLGAKNPLPYSLAINWSTYLPQSDKDCAVDIITRTTSNTVKVGETVRYTATISNKKDTDIPSTMALIGIPAGLSAQAWQLKELQEKGVYDYYEIKGNNLAIYYRGMGAKAVKEINLDLKAEFPGEFDTPASSAYLYYTNEYKTWCSINKINVSK